MRPPLLRSLRPRSLRLRFGRSSMSAKLPLLALLALSLIHI